MLPTPPSLPSNEPKARRLRARSTTAGLRFPLPKDTFPEIQLSDTQVHAYEAQVQDLIRKALRECERCDVQKDEAYASPWEVVAQVNGLTEMRRRDATVSTRAEYRLFGKISGNYRHLMRFYQADSDRDFFEWQQFMFQSMADARVLKTISRDAAQGRYLGIKWAALHPTVFMGKVDMLYLEYVAFTRDRLERDIGVRVTIPLHIPEVDQVMEAMKVRRIDSQLVQILRPSQSGHSTHVFYMADNDFPYFIPQTFTKRMITTAQNLAVYADSRLIAQAGLLPPSKWVANGSRKSCVVCTRAFKATRGRHHCRLCGDVVCRKCLIVRDAPEYTDEKIFKPVKTKFCVLCITKLREERRFSAADKPSSKTPLTSSTASSSSTSSSPNARDRTAKGTTLLSAETLMALRSDLEFAPPDFDVRSRGSFWSEAASEDEETEVSDIESSHRSLSSLSELSESSPDKRSFGSRLHDVASRIEDAVPEERAPRESLGRMDIAEIIDTRDMMPATQLAALEEKDSRRRGSSSFEASFAPGRTSRSLDQCLAEQEELLRRMVLAASAVQQSAPRRRNWSSSPQPSF
ncbi:hypothetical protein ATCC90586_010151 [Pythium insidiosum]|nr:hypothetical protein ATCC90586_010151 [Pythium insidiosum]